METLINFFIQINASLQLLNIDLIIVLLVIASGYFQSRYLTDWKLNASLKTLLIATIFTFIYLSLNCNFDSLELAKPCLLMAFISYAVATSFYEIIIKHTMTYINNKFTK